MQTNKQAQTFNDGIVRIYPIVNVSAPGDLPGWRLATVKDTLRFHRRTVGVQRLYMAKQADANIDLLLRCPYRPDVSTMDIAVPTIDDMQYKISDIQVPEDVHPPVMDLTLKRLEVAYDANSVG